VGDKVDKVDTGRQQAQADTQEAGARVRLAPEKP